MNQQYTPGPPSAEVQRNDGDTWTLVLVRELRHAPEKVWLAITDPAHLRDWAPFDADGNMGVPGAKVTLSTINTPREYIAETTVKRAEAPKLLEYEWGGGDVRWELEPMGQGTKLTLWANINRNYVAMGAAGWHVCLDVMDHLLGGEPIGRIVGMDAMKSEGWQKLHKEYSELFGVEMPKWTS